MSHWTTLKTQVRSIPALAAACTQLGVSLVAKGIARGYYNQRQAADYVIRLPGPYDIAVQQQEDGTLGLTTDWYAGHVQNAVGENFETLLSEYSHALTAQTAEAEGLQWYRIASQEDAERVNQELGLDGEEAVTYGGQLRTVLV